MQEKKFIYINDISKTSAFVAPWDAAYCTFGSPTFSRIASVDTTIADQAGVFLMSNCALNEQQCKNCLDVLLTLHEAIEKNDRQKKRKNYRPD